MKKLFKKLKKFLRKVFGRDGVVSRLKGKLERYGGEFTEKVDTLLTSTKLILDIANKNIDTLDNLGFAVPPRIAEALKRAALEVGYYDDAVNTEDGFKSVILAIASKLKGSKAHNEGAIFNISKLALVRMFPELRKSEAELIISSALALMKK